MLYLKVVNIEPKICFKYINMDNSCSQSKKEDAILDYIFDPEAKPLLPSLESIEQSYHGQEYINKKEEDMVPIYLNKIDSSELQRLKTMEAESVTLAENGKLHEAVDRFTEIIGQCDYYASGYNNRAQVYRLLDENDKAMEDIILAIRYGEGDKPVLKQAHAQRGALLMKLGKEEEAYKDFELAGQLGNELAKKQALRLNPYSKLCGQILTEVMSNYYTERP